MNCPEYLCLRQDYEAALRRWGQVMLPSSPAPTAEIKQKAYDERDGAKGKLDRHMESCPTCFKDKWKAWHTARNR
jgi:hypothetical protein